MAIIVAALTIVSIGLVVAVWAAWDRHTQWTYSIQTKNEYRKTLMDVLRVAVHNQDDGFLRAFTLDRVAESLDLKDEERVSD